jgi:uncharacterized protein YndB with AHSA1/START domain
MSKTNLQQQITIQASPSKVWRVLTDPQYLNQYFPEKLISSGWTEGSRLIFAGAHNHRETEQVGTVLEATPGLQLKFRVPVTGGCVETIICYELFVASSGVELKMTWETIPPGEAGYVREEQADRMLLSIKSLSESV